MALSEISLNEKEDRRERRKRCPLLHLFSGGKGEKKNFLLLLGCQFALAPSYYPSHTTREQKGGGEGERYCRSSGGAAAAEEEEGGRRRGNRKKFFHSSSHCRKQYFFLASRPSPLVNTCPIHELQEAIIFADKFFNCTHSIFHTFVLFLILKCLR